MSKAKKYRELICDYSDTVFAILGFMNFYRFNDETRTMRANIKAFQGRRLQNVKNIEKTDPDGKKQVEVTRTDITPDIGIVYTDSDGILAEVKKSFCKNKEHWIDDFEQLMSYDGQIEGWPTLGGAAINHEIALLVHQSRSRAVADFYHEKKGKEIQFEKPFSIIEFNRSDEASPYVFFRIFEGDLRDANINERLRNGVPVPLEKLSEVYEIKLYDTEPPCPYILEIIWTNVVLPLAMKDGRFAQMRKNGKFEVTVDVDSVVSTLSDGFSFKKLHESHDSQPMVPRKEWVLRAFDTLAAAGDGKWIDRGAGRFSAIFRKHNDVLGHFVEICAMHGDDLEEAEQTELFCDLPAPDDNPEKGDDAT